MIYPPAFIQYCDSLKIKLTALRKAVLYILWCEKKPLKAYEILDFLLKIKPNSTPPTVYRALMFFVSSDIVHKIESMQSYTLCSEPEKHRPSEVLMVCNSCHQVIEIYDSLIRTQIEKFAETYHFEANPSAIELQGQCVTCRVTAF